MKDAQTGRRADGQGIGWVLLAAISVTLGWVTPLAAQQPDSTRQRPARSTDAQGQLTARGLPAELAAQVAVVARETDGRGLPGQAVVDKAIEGWFKRVPPPRIVAAVRDLAQRLERARADLRAGGVTQPSGGVIAASAEATAQGIRRGDQVAIIRAAPSTEAAAGGLSVSAALVVQGLDPSTSARLVAESFRRGRSVAQVLDLPAAARALKVRGVTSSDVGRQLLNGITGTVGVQSGAGAVVRPVPLPIPTVP